MIVTVEISYYPLTEDFAVPIKAFLEALSKQNVSLEIGVMSSVATGDFDEIMNVLKDSMGTLMDQYPSIFNLKISNSCLVK